MMYKKNKKRKNIIKFEQKNLGKTLEKLYKEIITTKNIFSTIKIALIPISLWNAQVGILLQTFLSTISLGINVDSQKKAEDRLVLIIETIYKIWKIQQSGETNYEAALICPDLFRNALILKDEERVKEHLLLIEKLFTIENNSFNSLAELLKLINQLSGIEYKIMKLIPHVNTEWKNLLSIKELGILFETQKEHFTAAILSLINMNLVVKKLGIRMDGGPELGTIDFKDNIEYIRLSEFGQLFLKTIEEIKNEAL